MATAKQTFFKTFLHDKKANVLIDGLQSVYGYLRYNDDYDRLEVCVQNTNDQFFVEGDFVDNIQRVAETQGLSKEASTKIVMALLDKLRECYLPAFRLESAYIKHICCTFKDISVSSVTITFEDGNAIQITDITEVTD